MKNQGLQGDVTRRRGAVLICKTQPFFKYNIIKELLKITGYFMQRNGFPSTIERCKIIKKLDKLVVIW
ncbi:MAG: hypothetical protein A2Y62_20585 [Candidatus Fischerbacteria bacterium RBG_13_37_8]|uniref:Uncharacterized protein n=1 Tax=Candidatus Fischerbacteria bacterium RBG_13_37_8 TaxID=1817863 RepID=A0A1F5VFX5_9BACT|nr:MAG: hypothetical protein A2Y62_20585 [Candidatus Fischerbacteria bacterium RBG_13_37_8]